MDVRASVCMSRAVCACVHSSSANAKSLATPTIIQLTVRMAFTMPEMVCVFPVPGGP